MPTQITSGHRWARYSTCHGNAPKRPATAMAHGPGYTPTSPGNGSPRRVSISMPGSCRFSPATSDALRHPSKCHAWTAHVACDISSHPCAAVDNVGSVRPTCAPSAQSWFVRCAAAVCARRPPASIGRRGHARGRFMAGMQTAVVGGRANPNELSKNNSEHPAYAATTLQYSTSLAPRPPPV